MHHDMKTILNKYLKILSEDRLAVESPLKKVRGSIWKYASEICLSKQCEGCVEGRTLASENLKIIFDNISNDVCLRKSPIHYDFFSLKNLGLRVKLETFEIKNKFSLGNN